MTEAFEPLCIGSTVCLAMCEPDKQRGKLVDMVDMASHHQDGDVEGVTFDHAATMVYWNEELEVIHDCVKPGACHRSLHSPDAPDQRGRIPGARYRRLIW